MPDKRYMVVSGTVDALVRLNNLLLILDNQALPIIRRESETLTKFESGIVTCCH